MLATGVIGAPLRKTAGMSQTPPLAADRPTNAPSPPSLGLGSGDFSGSLAAYDSGSGHGQGRIRRPLRTLSSAILNLRL